MTRERSRGAAAPPTTASAEVVVRGAVADDYPTFVRLVAELGVDDPIPAAETFVAELAPHAVIAEDGDGAPLGYAFFHVMNDVAYVRHLVTAPSARRRGVGRALLAAIAARARDRGCASWCLNVLPDNAAAIALYASVGMEPRYRSRSLRIAWACVDAAPASSERATARLIAPEDDARVERDAGLLPGQLAQARATGNRVLLALEDADGAVVGAAVFNPAFPGAFPFRVARPALALPLLREIRRHARATDAVVHLTAENDPALAEALLALGATVRLEILRMSGPLRAAPLRPGSGPASSAA